MESYTVVSSGSAFLLLTASNDHDKFAELLGVTDCAAFRYNAELRRMASLFRLRHISFVRVRDLLPSGHGSDDLHDLNEDEHLVNAPITREEFLSTDIGNYNAEAHVKFDEDALRKYRGYLRSLKLDLEGREAQMWQKFSGHEARQTNLSRKTRDKLVSATADRMMENGAVRTCFQSPTDLQMMTVNPPRNSLRSLSGPSRTRCA